MALATPAPRIYAPHKPLPAQCEAEPVPTGTDPVLGLDVRHGAGALAVDVQHPVAHSHASLGCLPARRQLQDTESQGELASLAQG